MSSSTTTTTDPGDDKFGLKMFFPSLDVGSSWYLGGYTESLDPNHDPRLRREGSTGVLIPGPDDSWGVSDNSKVRLIIDTNDTVNGVVSKDHAVIRERGFARNLFDWKNVEITGRFMATNASDQLTLYARSSSHIGGGPDCGGHSYKGTIQFGPGQSAGAPDGLGATRWAKEQWHVMYSFRPWLHDRFPERVGVWVGYKVIIYNKIRSTDQKMGVICEQWISEDNDNNWVMINSTEDYGGWQGTGGDSSCNGDADQIITWGGPETAVRWDGGQIYFKDLSVREIDPEPRNIIPPTRTPAAPPLATGNDPVHGRKMIYQTKSGGETFYLPSPPQAPWSHPQYNPSSMMSTPDDPGYRGNPLNDGRDNSYATFLSVDQGDVVTTADYNKNNIQANHATNNAINRRYMMNPKDWKNVEMTFYTYATSTGVQQPFDAEAVGLSVRGGSGWQFSWSGQTCEFCLYSVYITYPTGKIRISKRVNFDEEPGNSAGEIGSIAKIGPLQGNLLNRWLGIKFVVYNEKQVNGSTGVKLEVWLDKNNTNTFVKVHEYTDISGWNHLSGSHCGDTPDHRLYFGGPVAGWWCDNMHLEFKWLSIRELVDVENVAPGPPECPTGYHYVEGQGCVLDTPQCPPGQHWDAAMGMCMPDTQPPPSGDTTLDQFGVKKIYPTITGGEESFIDMNIPGGSRVNIGGSGGSIIKNPDGSLRLTNETQVRLTLLTSVGWVQANTTQDHSVARARGYLYHPKDWKNCEITGFFFYRSGSDQITQYARTARHTSPEPWCMGAAYKGSIFPAGTIRWAKEQWHVSYVWQFQSGKNVGVNSIVNRWIGYKVIMYNKVVDGQTEVHLEMYINDNADKVTWRKLDADYIDRGGWGDAGDDCKGDPDQIITWGGPFATYRWDGPRVDFKWLSVREIDPNGNFSEPPPPTGSVALVSKHRYNVGQALPGHCTSSGLSQ